MSGQDPRDAVRALCARAAGTHRDDPTVAQGIDRIRTRLDRPLRVVVAGRLNAGKSTLVNALLGRRMAPVGPVEVTRVVACFRDGPGERVAVHARDGRRWTVPLTPSGTLPADLGAPPEQLERLDVTLSHAALRGIEIVDTPGLDSLNTAAGAATANLLGLDGVARDAAAGADVLLFLLPRLTPADEERLRSLATAETVAAGVSVVAVLGVLSKADLGDPDAVADTARRYRERLRGVVRDVVAVSGLAAETVGTGRFTEALAADLVRLAELDADERELLLADAGWFVEADLPDGMPDRERRSALVSLLDLTGVRRCLALADAGHRDASAMSRALLDESGMERLGAAMHLLLDTEAAGVVAARALGELERLSYSLPDGARLRDELDDLRAVPALHRLRELDVLHRWSRGELDLAGPPVLADDLARLAGATHPVHLVADAPDPVRTALDGAARWLAVENSGGRDRATVRAAEVLRESWTRAWQQVQR